MEPTALLITAVVTLAGVITTLAGAFWKIATWLRAQVVEPLVKSHLELIDTLKAEIPRQSQCLQDQADVQVESAASAKRMEEAFLKYARDSGEHLLQQQKEAEKQTAILRSIKCAEGT